MNFIVWDGVVLFIQPTSQSWRFCSTLNGHRTEAGGGGRGEREREKKKDRNGYTEEVTVTPLGRMQSWTPPTSCSALQWFGERTSKIVQGSLGSRCAYVFVWCSFWSCWKLAGIWCLLISFLLAAVLTSSGRPAFGSAQTLVTPKPDFLNFFYVASTGRTKAFSVDQLAIHYLFLFVLFLLSLNKHVLQHYLFAHKRIFINETEL